MGCMPDETMSRETMALAIINKINNKLKFLCRKNRFLTPTLRWLLCNAVIQPHFNYACSAWYPSLTKKLKNRIQTSQNKCIRFCLQLDKMTHISHKEFETLNWLPVTERFNQCINSIVFKYISQSGVIVETEGNIWKMQKREPFHYKKVNKGTTNFTSPYVYSLFTIFLIKQIFEKNKSPRVASGSWTQL